MPQNIPQLREQEDILRLISEQCAREIITFIQTEPKSAIQISSELGIELCATYRRLHKFQKYDLLEITFKITPDGKKSFYYQSKIDSIIASYQKGKFDVSLDFNHM